MACTIIDAMTRAALAATFLLGVLTLSSHAQGVPFPVVETSLADMRAALETAQAIQSGTVVINGWRVVVPYAPYAGWRGSGVGCELGRPGLEAFEVSPTPLPAVAPEWLGRFHKGGRFASRRAQASVG